MNVKEIKQLMQAFSDNALTEMELTEQDFSLKLKRETAVQAVAAPVQTVFATAQPAPAGPIAAPVLGTEGTAPEAAPLDDDVEFINSPIIGTFYRAPNPEAEAYVNVGDTIRKGQVLCIIEAMKIMNEIEAEVEGTVVKIFPKNTEAVEYGQQLFAIKPL